MPIFNLLLKKIVKRAHVFREGCASKTWSFSSACKNLEAQHFLGAEIWSSKKCVFGGYNSTTRSPMMPYETLLDLFRSTREELLSNE